MVVIVEVIQFAEFGGRVIAHHQARVFMEKQNKKF